MSELSRIIRADRRWTSRDARYASQFFGFSGTADERFRLRARLWFKRNR